MPYLMGLLEGFQGAKNADYERNLAADASRRQTEGRIYETLMQSRDPEIQALALSGLFESAQPSKRAKGLGGYMGEVQGGQIYPQILALMNQMQRVEAPNGPGSAAMPAQAPVRAGSPPMPPAGANPMGEIDGIPTSGSGEILPSQTGMGGGSGDVPFSPGTDTSPLQAGAGNPAGGPAETLGPPPIPTIPLESRWKRRGTGIPTAEEIAEHTARRQARAKDEELIRTLQMVNASEDEITAAILGSHGAPQRTQVKGGPPVLLPGQTTPTPTVIVNGRLVSAIDGSELPVGTTQAAVPRAPTGGGGGGAAGALSSVMEDTPENREWLTSLPGGEALAGMPPQTGGIRVKRGVDGHIVAVLPAMQAEPLQTGGRATVLGPDGQPQLVNLDRAGNPVGVVGKVDNPQPTQTRQSARALARRVERWQQAENSARRARRRPNVSDQELDAKVQEFVRQTPGATFRTYQDVLFAAEEAPRNPSAPPPASNFGDRIRQRIEQGRSGAPPQPAGAR